jgi:hypothetical protein
MPSLEEMLRNSLKGANDKYDEANRSLRALVVDTAKAVEAVTGARATLVLEAISNQESETQYDLVIVVKDSDQSRCITHFSIPDKGFPIHRLNGDAGRVVEKFNSEVELSTYFEKLASSEDSPLVLYLAFLARNVPPVSEYQQPF